MNRQVGMASLALASAAILGGCATVPRDAGFSDISKTVTERTGARIRWDRGTEEDKDVSSHVAHLLDQELTSESAVQVALLRNESLKATYEELGIAQAELVEAGLLRNPTVGAEVRFPKHARLPFEVDVTQTFVDLILLPLRKRVAGAAFEAAKLRVTNEVLAKASETKAAFYRTQGAEQLVEMRRTVLRATEASYDVATRLHDAGNITDLDYARERALYEGSKVDLARAEAEALGVREELNAVMGVWGKETTWKASPRLPDLPATEVSPSGLEGLAIKQRADLGAARNDVVATAQYLGLSRYSLLGDATIGGHFEQDADGTTTVGPSIQVPLPIFNQGQPAVAAAESRLRQSQHRYAALAVQIRADVRRTRNRLITARDRAVYYQKVLVPLRHEIVSHTQLQYNAMLSGVFELLQAKQSEIDSGREYVEALTDYWVTRSELERAVGGRLDVTKEALPAPTTAPTQSTEHQHHGE